MQILKLNKRKKCIMIHVKVRWLWESNTSFSCSIYEPRLSTRSTQAEAPAGFQLLSGGTTPPPLLSWLSGLFRPWSNAGLGILGGQPLLAVTGPSSPSQGGPALFHHVFPQLIELRWPCPPAVLQCAPASPGPPFLAADRGDRIRLFEWWEMS